MKPIIEGVPLDQDVVFDDYICPLLRIKPGTARRMRSTRRIPFHKVPGSSRVYYLRSEILEWMKSGEVQARS